MAGRTMTSKHGCELDMSCEWVAGTGLHADGTPCVYGQRVLAADYEQDNDEDKRWEWSRDAFSWSARDAADQGENQ